MTGDASTLERIADLDREERDRLLEETARQHGLSPTQLRAQLSRSWRFLGRPKQFAPPGDDWMFWWIRAGRGFGKLLHEETRLPTPSGWATMREVEVGDEVFDETGRRCSVTWKSERALVDAYRVSFSDGSSILACADHQWTTWDHPARKAYLRSAYENSTVLPEDWPVWRPRRRRGNDVEVAIDGPGPRTRSSYDIASSVRQGERGDLNHSIPVCDALDLPDADLLIDPYVLGYWLGVGSSRNGQVTIHPDDQPSFFEHARRYQPRRLTHPNQIGTRGLHRHLRLLGLLQNKHVPRAYLRGSAEQRLALLQGLMDSDGHALARTSHVEFASSLPGLAEAVMELATSLGQKPTLASGPSFLAGRQCLTRYRVTWRPTVPCFRLPRKAERIRPLGAQAFRSLHRMIVSVEPTGVHLPMFCIAVDSPHRMYLAGDAMVPTHNTLSGAQFVKEKALERRCRIGIIAPTLGDARNTCIEGETGLLSVIPPAALMGQSRAHAWNRSNLELTLANGTKMQCFSSEEPDRLRGPQHDYVWGEEVSSWRDAKKGDADDTTWSNMKLGLRLGPHPRAVLTSTPKANKLTKELAALAKTDAMRMVTGSSFENRGNLSEAWWNTVVLPLIGTRTGRQEIEAEILEDVEGALWTRSMIDALRIPRELLDQVGWDPAEMDVWRRRMRRIVVGVDPNTTSGEAADDAGVIVAGLGHSDEHGYVLDDRTQTRGGPRAWAQAAVDAYYDWQADRIVVETNNGGEMCVLVIHGVDPSVPVKMVTASRGKRTRAEPVAALYESDEKHDKQGRVHHVGVFPELEDEMTTWTPEEESPNRMDALVWALTDLKLWDPPAQHRGTSVPRGTIPGVRTSAGSPARTSQRRR